MMFANGAVSRGAPVPWKQGCNIYIFFIVDDSCRPATDRRTGAATGKLGRLSGPRDHSKDVKLPVPCGPVAPAIPRGGERC
jgi:hypothetical protein